MSLKYNLQVSFVRNQTLRTAGGRGHQVWMIQSRGEWSWRKELERGEKPRWGKQALQEGRLGHPRFINSPEGTSRELKSCPTWQLGAGLDGVLSSQPHPRALCEGFFNRQEVAQAKHTSQGCSVIGPTPERLVSSLQDGGHVAHVTRGQLGDIPRSYSSLLYRALQGGQLGGGLDPG